MVTRSQARMAEEPATPSSDTHSGPPAGTKQQARKKDASHVLKLLACAVPLLLGMLGPIAVLIGISMQVEGVKRPASPIPVMAEYNIAFKKAGLLFPFFALAFRVVMSYVAGHSPFDGPISRSLPVVFLLVSGVRAGVYGLTLMMPHETMSDHVFMGLSIAALARLDLFASLDTMRKTSSRKAVMVVPALVGVMLCLLTHANNYITCRYFHSAEESMMSLGAGLAMFEVPVTFLLFRSLSRRFEGIEA
ncbi:hypothetical protein T484DRAFT_1922360 [Baffinella frigidus]|nr:hypothetical protein T484DRAFT_1922360 [Cryptophyta sp. CCMP2293]|mmetsp:Transcript_34499/g.81720  ORF Transcript_34499/g.81720 Transcript_34499/m.81720 type:complete len:248 (-) Transcript_34499:72-815(-)